MQVFTVDFTGVETGGSFYIPEGNYQVVLSQLDQVKKPDKEYAYLLWKFKPVNRPEVDLNYVTSLNPTALFKLKGLLMCLGIDVPDGSLTIQPTELIGRIATAVVADREHNGKVYSSIADILPPEQAMPSTNTGAQQTSPEDDLL